MKLFKKTACICLAALLLFSFSGCAPASPSSAPGQDAAPQGPVRIATKPMTEQYILGEMLSLIIEHETGYQTEITKGVGGGTNNIHPAMESGQFDLYPEYTSSGWVMVLGHDAKGVGDDEMLQKLKEEYQSQFNMTWVGLYGFNNTFTVAVRGDVAREYGLKTCSDLAEAAGSLVFGGNPDYIEREDGFPALCAAYGLSFKSVSDIDIGLKYQALASGDIDVTNAFTTDAQLGVADVTTLEDDLGLQVNYFCSTVVREDALSKYPGLEDALMKMDGLLTDKEMAALNYKVEAEGQDERDVAREFLISKGLLES